MGMRKGVRDLRADQCHFDGRKRTALGEHHSEAVAVDELHHDERVRVLAPVVDRHDVRVVQARRRSGLTLEPLRRDRRVRRGGNLHRNRPVEHAVARPVHVAHAAGPEMCADLVAIRKHFRDLCH